MCARRGFTIIVVGALLVGCAARVSLVPPAHPAIAIVDRSALPLEVIGPAPRLPPGLATRPHGRPPVEALVAYAAARDALARGDTTAAVTALQRAASLDPDRFDVQNALGKALAATARSEASAIAAYARAADLDPDDVGVQTELGRLRLAAGQPEAAIARLRLAMQTTGYGADASRAAVVDLLLARSLAAAGFDRAALDRYLVLIGRFRDATVSVGDHPDLMALADHPALLLEPIGRLYDRHEQWTAALHAYLAAAAQDGESPGLQRAIAMDRAHLGRRGDLAAGDAAVRQAANLVVHDDASPTSLALLADVCRGLGQPDRELSTLARVSADRPRDAPLLLAYVNALIAHGGPLAQAERLVRAALAARPNDPPLLDALGWLLYRQGRFADARPLLERAARAAVDAGVLDHLGDTLYRLDQRPAARRAWERALAVLPADGDPASGTLRAQIERKVRQAVARQSVDVARLAMAGH